MKATQKKSPAKSKAERTENPLFRGAPSQALLTPKQKGVLDFILEFSKEKGYAPSQQEIAKHFGFSSLGTVQNYLVRLERQGVLAKQWNAKRSLAVQASAVPPQAAQGGLSSHQEETSFSLPLLGRVAAGRPIEANLQGETLDVPRSMKRPGELFALQVQGSSMIEDGILDGDYVIIRKQALAQNGQTVVAMINNEATIKRYYKKDELVELHPANALLKPILVEADASFRIEGVLVGVIRHF